MAATQDDFSNKYEHWKEKQTSKWLEDGCQVLCTADKVDVVDRLSTVQMTLQMNAVRFSNQCAHVDIANAIMDYIDFYCNVKYNPKLVWIQDPNELLEVIVRDGKRYKTLQMTYGESFLAEMFSTLYYLSGDISFIQIYLKYFQHSSEKYSLQDLPINFSTVWIIVEVADFNAILDNLKMYGHRDHITIEAIWVQESIKKKFSEFLTEYFLPSYKLCGFRSQQELYSEIAKYTSLDSISIWTEDITTANRFARSMKVPLVFINGSEEVCSRITIPSIQKYFKRLKGNEFYEVQTLPISPEEFKDVNNIYNLFYDGSWKKPTYATYWGDKENNMWAIATKTDVSKYYESAKKGYKTWSSSTVYRRKEALSNFASRLKCNKNSKLAEDILLWMESHEIFQSSLLYSKDRNVEIHSTREPLGVIILRATNERFLFLRLVQALTAGNSVIVIPDDTLLKSCIQYPDMFVTCGFPAGVVNFLFRTNLNLSSISQIGKEKIQDELIYFEAIQEEENILSMMDGGFKESQLLRMMYMEYTLGKYILFPIN